MKFNTYLNNEGTLYPDRGYRVPCGIFALLILAALAGAENLTKVDLKLKEIERKFQSAYDSRMKADYDKKMAQLRSNYRIAVVRALGNASNAGNLEKFVVLREEQTTVESGGQIPAADDEGPEELKKLRATFHEASAKFVRERELDTIPLYRAYDKALANYQTELVRHQQLPQALKVKEKRSEISTRIQAIAKVDPPVKVATPAKTTNLSGAELLVTAGISENTAPKLKVLTLNQLSDELAMVLPEMPLLRELTLGSGVLTSKGLIRIAGQCPNLVKLHFQTKMTDKDFEALRNFEGIQNFSWDQGKMSAAQVAALGKIKSLRYFSLWGRQSDAEPGGFEKLGVQGLNIGTENLNHLFPEALKIRSLESLSFHPSIRESEFVAAIDKLPKFSQIKSITITGQCDWSERGMEALAKMKSLEAISRASFSRVRNKGVAHLVNLKKLHTLEIVSAPNLSDASVEHFIKMKTLKKLTLKKTKISEGGFAKIRKGLPGCKVES